MIYQLSNQHIDVFSGTGNDKKLIGEICRHPIKGWIFLNLETYDFWCADDLETLIDLIAKLYPG